MSKQALGLYEPSFAFTVEQLEEMLALQAQANAVMITDDEDVPYYRASVVESVEAIQHFGYKWWKNTEPDLGQAKMELIDILHFALSDVLKERSDNDIVFQASYLEKVLKEAVSIFPVGRLITSKKHIEVAELYPELALTNHTAYKLTSLEHITFNDLAEQLIYFSLICGKTSFSHLLLMFEKLEMTPLEVHGLYLGKNTLNKFRMANGQKENRYFKIWNGKEDNEHLTHFIEKSARNNQQLHPQEIHNFLLATYNTVDLS